MTGDIAHDLVRRVTASKCFLGASGISAKYGLASATSPEPAVNALMIERSKECIVVADSSKLGHESSFQFASADEVDLLITDTGATDAQVAELEAYGLKRVVRVDPSLAAEARRSL